MHRYCCRLNEDCKNKLGKRISVCLSSVQLNLSLAVTSNNYFTIYILLYKDIKLKFHKRVESVHSYETRGSIMSYVIPESKMQGKKTFMYNGAKLWNSLDVSTRSIQCKNRLKKRV